MFYGQGAGAYRLRLRGGRDGGASVQPRREEIGWEADPAGFEDPQALRSRYYFRIGGSLSAAARPSARWRSSARTAVRPPSSPTASAEPRQGSRPKACASWPVCGCWDKPQTAGRCVYWNRREPGFET
ncbi:MAG: hypothetical protein ACLTYN_08205 [Dysosmobacter welbionis]